MNDIIIVEDQKILRDALKCALEASGDFKVVADSADADEAAALCEKFRPGLVLLDVCTEGGHSGIEAAAQIKKIHPEIKVVIMTGMPDVSFVKEARQAGADSFIYKNIGTDDLVSTLRSTLCGYTVFVNDTNAAIPCYAQLTEKETEILRHVCEGMNRSEIAVRMFLSENTVRSYISEILSKTGFSSILKLAVFAVSNDYITPLNDKRAQ